MITRRQIVACATLLLASLSVRTSRAAAVSNKPVRLVSGHPPGGQSDIVARIIAPRLGETLGQPIVIENRSGAAGTIAAVLVAKASPDSSTLLICSTGNLSLARVMVPDLPYDPIRDLAMVARIASIPTVLAVGHWVPATNMGELVDYAKTRPGALTAASSGVGSSSGFALELLKAAAGIDILQVPYGGLAPAVNGLLSRQVDMVFADLAIVAAHAKTGTLRLLGTPASARFAAAPDVATLQQQGFPDVVLDTWIGIVVPAGTPGEVVANLARALTETIRTTDVRQRLREGGFEPIDDTPTQFTASVKDDIGRFTAVAARLGIGAAKAGTGSPIGGS